MRAAEMGLLRDVISRRRPDLLPTIDEMADGSLSEEECEALREAVAEELVQVGLDERDEPNKRGRELEALIDWLGHQ